MTNTTNYNSILKDKHILVAVTGSISAHKSIDLIRRLKELGAIITPLITKGAQKFISPLALSVAAHQQCLTDLWLGSKNGLISHIDIAYNLDLILIAPCSAKTMGVLAHGISTNPANDLLLNIVLSSKAPLCIAPAMETNMWAHPMTTHHTALLQSRGAMIIEPESGKLASGKSGKGRLPNIYSLIDHAEKALHPQILKDKHFIITGGASYESLDPVRFISNHSSGKMGLALAKTAWKFGASISLYLGEKSSVLQLQHSIWRMPDPSVHNNTHFNVNLFSTTKNLLDQLKTELTDSFTSSIKQQEPKQKSKQTSKQTVLIMAAAPSDYAPVEYSERKIKKKTKHLDIQCEQQPDILKTLGDIFIPSSNSKTSKKSKQSHKLTTIGFAAESNDHEKNALRKLKDKSLDYIILNSIAYKDSHTSGFSGDANSITIFKNDDKHENKLASISENHKLNCAEFILKTIFDLKIKK